MKLAQLFYPDIENTGWEEKLYEKLKTQLGEKDDCVIFVQWLKKFTRDIRGMRNESNIKYPGNTSSVQFTNYRLTSQNILEKPSISFTAKDYVIEGIQISKFVGLIVKIY